MNQTDVNNFLKCFLQIETPAARDDDHDHDHDHDHDDEATEEAGNVVLAKVTAMVVLFCASALCGTVPFLLNRCFHWTEKQTNARSATVVKCLLYFGGGVLLSTTFLHLLPEVQEVAEQLQECGIIAELNFPLAQLLMCCGFFLMYFIEEAMHSYVHRYHALDDGAAAAFERGQSIRNSVLIRPSNGQTAPAASAPNLPTVQEVETQLKSRNTTKATAMSSLSTHDLVQNDIENQKYQEANATASPPPAHTCHRAHLQHQQHAHHHHQHPHQHHGHSHLPLPAPAGVSEHHGADMLTSSLRGLFIVLALSLHELFEGMAIGLESSASSVWFMFGAVSAHKLVLAFCVGVELIVARTRLALACLYIITFAIVSPLGIGIGIWINVAQGTAGPNLTSAILQGFACGTLLYVVFFEILSKNRSGLKAYLALFVGFLIMFGLQQLGASGGHGHSHSHSCSTVDDHEDEHLHDHASGRSELSAHHHHSHSHAHGDHHHAEEALEKQLQVLRQLLESHVKKE